jgi:aminocarboxymuconate-semialdehyde decarboxylase
MTIDIHAHALDEAFLAGLARKPEHGWKTDKDAHGRYVIEREGGHRSSLDQNLHDLPRRLASLTARGIELQLVGPPPGFIAWPGGAANVEQARALNAQTARVAAAGEGRIEGVAALALADPGRAADELRRTLAEYGFRSAIIPSTAGGRPLDDEVFKPLFDLIDRTGILLFMHPVSAEPPTRFGMHGVHVLVGWPFETTLAVTRMIFSGMFERYGNLRLVLAHGGGNLTFLKGRLDSAYHAEGWEADPFYRKHIKKPPGDYFSHIYFDTCALSPASVDFVVRVAGAERVMFGSDYPFDIGDPEGRQSLPAIHALPREQQELIFTKNAASVLDNVRREQAHMA